MKGKVDCLKKLFWIGSTLGLMLLTATPAIGAALNPDMGDNSIVPLVVGVMAAAAVGLVVVLLLTRGKK